MVGESVHKGSFLFSLFTVGAALELFFELLLSFGVKPFLGLFVAFFVYLYSACEKDALDMNKSALQMTATLVLNSMIMAPTNSNDLFINGCVHSI